jgi:hypothetical protein
MTKKTLAITGGKTAGISDEAVRKATGKTWGQWGRLLDKDGCKRMPHKEIAEFVHEKHGVGSWWSQMVTVGYEQSRGLRQAHETCRGWQASVSRTVEVPIAKMFNAWTDDETRKQWMGKKKITIRKATKNKSMRITWPGETSLEVNFYSKSAAKSQITVQHGKLTSEDDVAKSKKYWAGAMEKLKEILGA